MSSGSATVPLWWSKIKQPQAHERLLGSIEFYRRKWEGGAHWPSSEDASATASANLSATTTASNVQGTESGGNNIRKEWPGYNREEARDGYLTRSQTCKVNRRNFEKASQKPKEPSHTAVQNALLQRDLKIALIQKQQEENTVKNYWEREKERRDNKVLATEASQLIRPRPGAVKPHYVHLSARSVGSEQPDWYGRRNTRPW